MMNSGVCVLRLAVRSKSSVCLCTVRCVCVCEFALVREETMYTVCYVPVRMHVCVCECVSSVFVWILQIIVCFLVLRSIPLT